MSSYTQLYDLLEQTDDYRKIFQKISIS